MSDLIRIGFIDVETTGLSSASDQIVELAIISATFDKNTGKFIQIDERYVGRRDPGMPIPAAATKFHGIKNVDVKGKKLDIERILKIIKGCDNLAAHNAKYDRGFVDRLIPESKKKTWYCTMSGINWRSHGSERKSLAYLSDYFRLSVIPDHSAESDVLAAMELMKLKPRGKYLLLEMLDNGILRRGETGRSSSDYARREVSVSREPLFQDTDQTILPLISTPRKHNLLVFLGWLFIPYIMLPFWWNRLDRNRRTLGIIWSVMAIMIAIFNRE